MRKIKWNRNFSLGFFKNLDIPHEAVFFYKNSRKRCSIRFRIFLEIIKPGIFGCMESAHCHQSAANLLNLICNIAFLTCILHHLGVYQNSQSDQLPYGLIAQLVEHCTGIPEIMVNSNPIEV